MADTLERMDRVLPGLSEIQKDELIITLVQGVEEIRNLTTATRGTLGLDREEAFHAWSDYLGETSSQEAPVLENFLESLDLLSESGILDIQ